MKIVSTYSGAGGLDWGFHEAGGEVVAAAELDKDACETFRRNFPATELFQGLVSDAHRAGFFDRSPDLVIGGPPCQGFSVAGKMNPSDPRSAEVFNFMAVVDSCRPAMFVMENVKALAVLTKWEAVREELFRRALASGYRFIDVVLNSSDFGVPQRRERMFFIGLRTDVCSEVDAEVLLTRLKTELSKTKLKTVTLRDLLLGFGPAGSQGNDRVCRAKVTFAANPVLRRSPYAGMLFNGAGRPLPLDGVCSTLPASMGGNKTPIVDEQELFGDTSSFVERYHAHLMRGGKPRKGDAPKRLRRLTVNECIAIQSFPNTFEFFGTQSSVYKQIGNSVPPLMARAVAKAVKRTLQKASRVGSAQKMRLAS